MVTTIGNIPDWSKNGSKEFYTAGGVGIEVLCWGKSKTIPKILFIDK